MKTSIYWRVEAHTSSIRKLLSCFDISAIHRQWRHHFWKPLYKKKTKKPKQTNHTTNNKTMRFFSNLNLSHFLHTLTYSDILPGKYCRASVYTGLGLWLSVVIHCMLLPIELLLSGSTATEISNEEKDLSTPKTLNCPPASTSFIHLYHNAQMKLPTCAWKQHKFWF